MDQRLDIVGPRLIRGTRSRLKVEKAILFSEERLSLKRKSAGCDLLEMRIGQVESAFRLLKRRDNGRESALLSFTTSPRGKRRDFTRLDEPRWFRSGWSLHWG
jgi:hypothetical protein